MKIGRIYSVTHSKSDFRYIGSTYMKLHQRFYFHINDTNTKTSLDFHMKKHNKKDYSIHLLGEYSVIDKKHLKAYEQLWMNKLRNNNRIMCFNPLHKCRHNHKTSGCTKCGIGKYLCEHRRNKYSCIECGGKNVCEHQKLRKGCRDCKTNGTGGKNRCHHNKIKRYCKECKGISICPHSRMKRQCRECESGNKIFCEHDRSRSKCKDCKRNGTGGTMICDHDKVRTSCSVCNGVNCEFCGKRMIKYSLSRHINLKHS